MVLGVLAGTDSIAKATTQPSLPFSDALPHPTPSPSPEPTADLKPNTDADTADRLASHANAGPSNQLAQQPASMQWVETDDLGDSKHQLPAIVKPSMPNGNLHQQQGSFKQPQGSPHQAQGSLQQPHGSDHIPQGLSVQTQDRAEQAVLSEAAVHQSGADVKQESTDLDQVPMQSRTLSKPAAVSDSYADSHSAPLLMHHAHRVIACAPAAACISLWYTSLPAHSPV